MKAFLSHPPNDRGWAESLAAALKEAGVDVWLEPAELRPGESRLDAVVREFADSDAAIVVVPAESREHWRQRPEWSAMLLVLWDHPGKKLVPVRLGDAALPGFAKGMPVVDALPGDAPSKQTVFELLDALKSDLSMYDPDNPERRSPEQERRWQERLEAIALGTSTLQSGD